MAKAAKKERFVMLMGPKPKPITVYNGLKFPADIGTIVFVGDTNKSSEVNVVRINEFKGKRSLDVRRFYEKNGAWAPGKGVSVPAAGVGDFLEGLHQNTGRLIQALSLEEQA